MASRDARRALYLEKKYATEIRKALRKQMIEYFKNGSMGNQFGTVLKAMYEEQARWWLSHEYSQLTDRVQKSSAFFLPEWDKWIRDFVTTGVAESIVEVDETTKDIVRKIMDDGARSGLQYSEIASNITKRAKSIKTYNRAFTIARTEMGSVINSAKTRSSEDFEIETGLELGKLWIHRGSSDPRDSHLAVDTGIAIPKDAHFIVDGEMMLRPHDPSASAKNVVNCGCQIVYTRL